MADVKAPYPAGLKYLILLLPLLIPLIVLAVASAKAAGQIESVEMGVDDANIFYVYARNLINGHGFVWNVGGERVEGFSSLSWVLVLSLLFGLFDAPDMSIQIINIAVISFAMAMLIHGICRYDAAGNVSLRRILLGTAFCSVWLVQYPSYIGWTVLSKMETGLWSSLLIISTSLLLNARHHRSDAADRNLGLVAVIPLLVITRPEGVLWTFVIVGTYVLIRLANGTRLLDAILSAKYPIISFVATNALLYSFRLVYFKSLFPNTYYAKVSPDRQYTYQMGYEYFLAFIKQDPVTHIFAIVGVAGLLIGGVALLVVFLKANRVSPAVKLSVQGLLTASIMAVIGLAVPVIVGGDHFVWFRFYQPIWPLLILPVYYVLSLLLQAVCSRFPRFQAANGISMAVVLIVSIVSLYQHTGRWNVESDRFVQEFVLAADGRKTGELINTIHPDLPGVGAIAVGGIQYAYKGDIIDLMGLNNVQMARHPGDRKGIKNHAAFSKEVFYLQRPEIVVPIELRQSDVDENQWRQILAFYVNHRWILNPLRGITKDREFLDQYTLTVVSRKDHDPERRIVGWYRNDYVKTLLQNPELNVVTL